MAAEHELEGLLDAARAGAPWALQRLYEELAPPVAGYLRLQGVWEVDDVVAFANRLRASVEEAPTPRPSPELTELLASDLPAPVGAATGRAAGPGARPEAVVSTRRASRARSFRQGLVARAAGLTLLTKVGLATAAAAVTTAGAGFTGVLPIPAAQSAFDRAFRVVAPVEVPEPTDRSPSDVVDDPGLEPVRPPASGNAEVDPQPDPETSTARPGGTADRAPEPVLSDPDAPREAPPEPGPAPAHGPSRPPLPTEPNRDPAPPEQPPAPGEDGPSGPVEPSDQAPQPPTITPEPEVGSPRTAPDGLAPESGQPVPGSDDPVTPSVAPEDERPATPADGWSDVRR